MLVSMLALETRSSSGIRLPASSFDTSFDNVKPASTFVFLSVRSSVFCSWAIDDMDFSGFFDTFKCFYDKP